METVSNIPVFQLQQCKIKFILHLADLHFSKNIDTIPFIKKQQIEAINNIYLIINYLNKKYDHQGICVIAGDLFDNKDTCTPKMFKLCIQFLKELCNKTTVILFLGNHDFNHHTHHNWLNFLNIIIPKGLIILKTSGYYVLQTENERHLLTYQSILDPYYSHFKNTEKTLKSDAQKLQCHNIIGLFHGTAKDLVNYSEEEYSKKAKNSNPEYFINLEWLKDADLVLLGHIHDRGKVGNNAYYSGSVYQKNFGETAEGHGCLIHFKTDKWNVQAYNFKTSFNRKIIKIDSVDQIPEVLSADKSEHILRLVYDPLKISKVDINKIIQHYQNNYSISDIETKAVYECPAQEPARKLLINQPLDYNNFLIKYLESQNQHELIKIINDNNYFISAPKTDYICNLNIISLKWKNVFCYGGDYLNQINFNNDLIALSADNTSGKSTIWKILLYGLYACSFMKIKKTHKYYDKNIINNQAASGFIELNIILGNTRYLIKREFQRIKKKTSQGIKAKTVNLKSTIINLGNIQESVDLSGFVGSSAENTYPGDFIDPVSFENQLIPYDILDSNYSINRLSVCPLDTTNLKIQKYISKTLNLDQITDLIATVNKDISDKVITLNKHKGGLESLQNEINKFWEGMDDNFTKESINELQEKIKTELKQLKKPVNKYAHYPYYGSYGPSGHKGPYGLNGPSGLSGPAEIIDIPPNSPISVYYQIAINKENLNDYLIIDNPNKELIKKVIRGMDIQTAINKKNYQVLINYLQQNQISIPAKPVKDDRIHFYLNKIENYLFYEISGITMTYEEAVEYLNYQFHPINNMFDNLINNENYLIADDIPNYENFNKLVSVYQNLMNNDLDKNDNKKYHKIMSLEQTMQIVQNLSIQNLAFPDLSESLNKETKMIIMKVKKYLNNPDIELTPEIINYGFELLKLIKDNPKIGYYLSNSYNFYGSVCAYLKAYLINYYQKLTAANKAIQEKIDQEEKELIDYWENIIKQAQSLLCSNEELIQFMKCKEEIKTYAKNIIWTIQNEYDTFNKNLEIWQNQIIDLNNKQNKINWIQSTQERLNKKIEDLKDVIDTQEREIETFRKLTNHMNLAKNQIIENLINNIEHNINAELERYVKYRIAIIINENNFSFEIRDSETQQILTYHNLSGYESIIIMLIIGGVINSIGTNNFNVFFVDEAFDVFDNKNFNDYTFELLQLLQKTSNNVFFVSHRTIPETEYYYLKLTINKVNNSSRLLGT